MSERCETCRYWCLPEEKGDETQCRRNAPVPGKTPNAPAWWPYTVNTDWCGEWRAKENDE